MRNREVDIMMIGPAHTAYILTIEKGIDSNKFFKLIAFPFWHLAINFLCESISLASLEVV
jgi:hypothetical protein